MTGDAFEVIVGRRGDQPRETAIANAAKYLSYGDQTNTLGESRVVGVEVYDSGESYGIGLTFKTYIGGDDALKRFMDQMAELRDVESVEQVSIE